MVKVDVSKEIRRAVDSGKVVFGQRQTQKSVLAGHAKIVVLAKNTPKGFREKIVHACKLSSTNFLEFEENGLELGAVCGKPHVVSVLAIEDTGKSVLMNAFKSK